MTQFEVVDKGARPRLSGSASHASGEEVLRMLKTGRAADPRRHARRIRVISRLSPTLRIAGTG
jgi:hypothetical protein